MRAALGAGPWRLVRLWLAEAAVLTGCGSVLGLLLAWWGVTALKAAGPPGIPRLDAVALDLPALAMAASSTLLAVLFFTIAPGRTHRAGLVEGLRAGSYGSGDSTRRHVVRNALTIAQCAGAATLLVLAFVLTRSFVKLMAVDLGWESARAVSMKVSPPMPRELRRPWYRYVEWSDRLVAGLEATPGLERAAITTQIPLSAQTYPAAIARGRGKDGRDAARWSGVAHSIPAVREVIQAVHPGTYVDQVEPLDLLVSRAIAQPRFTTRLVVSFASLALVLAAVGIYGTLSYVVGARTREIGIRLALGASRRAIVADVVRRGVLPAVTGGFAGLAVAVALVRTFRALLFGIEPVDPGSFAGGAAALLLVALAAALGPALRASRVDPAAALRAE